MMKWLKRLFVKEWEPLGTTQYFYSKENGEPIFTFSATFYMTPQGDRRVDIDEGIKSRLFPAKNHPFYHNFCIPYIKKTGDFASDEHSRNVVWALCEITKNAEMLYVQEYTKNIVPSKMKREVTDNVIHFTPKPKD